MKNADTSHDTILEDLANAITEEIEQYTGRVFVDRTIVERRIGDGSSQLRLRSWPVIGTLTTFAIDDVDYIEDEYWVDENAGVITLEDGAVFTRGGVIDVSYTAGYVTVPDRVIQLAKDMVKIRYDAWTSNSNAVTSLSQGQVSVVPLPDWPYAIKNTLNSLRGEQNP